MDGFLIDYAPTISRTEVEQDPWWKVDITPALVLRAVLRIPATTTVALNDISVVAETEDGIVALPLSESPDEYSASARKIVCQSPAGLSKVHAVKVQLRGSCSLEIIQVEVYGSPPFPTDVSPPLSAFNTLVELKTSCFQEIATQLNVWAEKHPTLVKLDKNGALMNEPQLACEEALFISASQLDLATQLLLLLNTKVPTLLSYVDLRLSDRISMLTDDVRAFRQYMLWSIKSKLLTASLDATKKSVNRPTVHVDFLKALEFVGTGQFDDQARHTVLGQVFQQLKNQPVDIYCIPFKARCFEVRFTGLHATDAGGPYRDCLEKVVKDLSSPALRLFVPTPNARLKLGKLQDQAIPNPAANSVLQLSLYKFVGRLMGLALRTRNLLNLSLPSLVWKALCKEQIDHNDVLQVDEFAYQALEEDGEQPTFTVLNCDGQPVSLIPEGFQAVTPENKEEFARLLRLQRLSWCKEQLEAIRVGLLSVVPVDILGLLTWRELEKQICGRGMSADDVALLKANSKLSNYKQTDDQIVWFWDILRNEFTDEQRAQFLTFCWGRSRLPLESSDFENQFVLTAHYSSTPDQCFPVAHTCFFTLDLPRYTSRAILLRMLSTAITTCVAIDADG